MHKSGTSQDLLKCIQQIQLNRKYYSPAINLIIENNPSESKNAILTAREIEILEHFSKGLTVNQTADTMFLSRHTIAAHRRKMFLKTNSNNIAELLNHARKSGII